MKQIYFALFGILLCSNLIAQIQTPYSTMHRVPKGWQLPITNGLVAYYPLLRNTRDESGSEQHAVPYKATLTTDRRGTENAAYTFDWQNSLIYCPLKNNQFDSVTIMCWVKSTATFQQAVLFYAGVPDRNGFGLVIGDGINSTGDKLVLLLGGNSPDGFQRSVTMPSQQWVHVTLVKMGTSWRLLMNGSVVATANVNYGLPGVPFAIGGAVENPNWCLRGALSDLIFYNRALTDTEIRVLYNR
jgi:hypothetical protein